MELVQIQPPRATRPALRGGGADEVPARKVGLLTVPVEDDALGVRDALAEGDEEVGEAGGEGHGATRTRDSTVNPYEKTSPSRNQ